MMSLNTLPEGDCSCTWSLDGTKRTAICPGHKALAMLSCCGDGEGCTSPTCAGQPEPLVCANCDGEGDLGGLRRAIEALAIEYERDGRKPVLPSHFTYLTFAKRLREVLGQEFRGFGAAATQEAPGPPGPQGRARHTHPDGTVCVYAGLQMRQMVGFEDRGPCPGFAQEAPEGGEGDG